MHHARGIISAVVDSLIKVTHFDLWAAKSLTISCNEMSQVRADLIARKALEFSFLFTEDCSLFLS